MRPRLRPDISRRFSEWVIAFCFARNAAGRGKCVIDPPTCLPKPHVHRSFSAGGWRRQEAQAGAALATGACIVADIERAAGLREKDEGEPVELLPAATPNQAGRHWPGRMGRGQVDRDKIVRT